MHVFGYAVLLAQGDGGLQPVLGVDEPLPPGCVRSLTLIPGPHFFLACTQQ